MSGGDDAAAPEYRFVVVPGDSDDVYDGVAVAEDADAAVANTVLGAVVDAAVVGPSLTSTAQPIPNYPSSYY